MTKTLFICGYEEHDEYIETLRTYNEEDFNDEIDFNNFNYSGGAWYRLEVVEVEETETTAPTEEFSNFPFAQLLEGLF